MVASTDVKYFTSSNLNAPQLTNSWGVLIDVFDAGLVNGITIGTVSTLTASGTTVTATFGTAHNVQKYQVISISGATQTEYNGDFRVLTVPNSTSLTFQLAATPSVTTATGTISAKLAPMGWEKSFSGTQKAAYRSSNALSNRRYLRVDNSMDPVWTDGWAKYAKVALIDVMSSIDDFSGVQVPYDSSAPTKNWVGTGTVGTASTVFNGWAKWYYGRANSGSGSSADSGSPTSTTRSWVLIGNDKFLIFLPTMNGATSTEALLSSKYRSVYMFGEFDSYIQSDLGNSLLYSTLRYEAASTSASVFALSPTFLSNTATLSALTDYTQAQTNISLQMQAIRTNTAAAFYSGQGDYATPSSSVPVQACDVILTESATASVVRGKVPIAKWCLQDMSAYNNLDIIELNGHAYLFVACLRSSPSFGGALYQLY